MPARPTESLTIVMAAFNEQEALPACVEQTLRFLRHHVLSGELVIVDDGSTDGTGDLIDSIAAREPEVRAFHLPRNMGMGAALLRGFAEARCAWVTILPGDGQLDAHDLLAFFDAAEHADIVTSVYRNRHYPLTRRILSLGLRSMTALIVGSRARSEGAYLIRRDLLERLAPRSQSFLLNLEIPIRARRAGCSFATVSMNVHERVAGRSKAVTIGRVLRTFLDQFALRLDLELDRCRSIAARATSRQG